MNYVVLTYSIYLPLTLGLTIWVARTLLKNGRTFLYDIFQKEQLLSDSVSRLLNVGVYLISIGFALLMLRVYYENDLQSMQGVIEILSSKVGGFVIILGMILFTNLFILLALRKGSKPVQATGSINVSNPQGRANI